MPIKKLLLIVLAFLVIPYEAHSGKGKHPRKPSSTKKTRALVRKLPYDLCTCKKPLFNEHKYVNNGPQKITWDVTASDGQVFHIHIEKGIRQGYLDHCCRQCVEIPYSDGSLISTPLENKSYNRWASFCGLFAAYHALCHAQQQSPTFKGFCDFERKHAQEITVFKRKISEDRIINCEFDSEAAINTILSDEDPQHNVLTLSSLSLSEKEHRDRICERVKKNEKLFLIFPLDLYVHWLTAIVDYQQHDIALIDSLHYRFSQDRDLENQIQNFVDALVEVVNHHPEELSSEESLEEVSDQEMESKSD